jgi:hypothetical protein
VIVTRPATCSLLAAALVAALSAAPVRSSAAASAPRGLVYGKVAVDGTPVSGARLTLTAWPNASTLDRLRPGDAVPTLRVAVASTDAAGDYAMTPDLARLDPSTYREGDGAVSLEEQVTTRTATTTYDFSAAPAATTRRTPLLADTRTNQQQLSFDLGAAATATARLTREPRGTTQAISAERLSRPVDPAGCGWGCPPPCEYHAGKKHYRANYERFMSLYTAPRAPASVKERTGSEHSVGIGVKVDQGAWSVGGSVTWTYNRSATAQLTYLHDLDLFNQINYRVFWAKPRDCQFDPIGKWKIKRQVRPVSWYDMLSWKWPIMRKWWPYCTNQKRRGTYTKEQGSNITYELGVTLPFIDLKAHASFSHDTEIVWHIRRPIYICGSTRDGWIESPQAAVRVKRHR